MTARTPSSLAELGLFTGVPRHEFFRMKALAAASIMVPSTTPMRFPAGDRIDLPKTYDFNGEARSADAFFTDTDTAALLVLKNGARSPLSAMP
jgi:hypothetical protein